MTSTFPLHFDNVYTIYRLHTNVALRSYKDTFSVTPKIYCAVKPTFILICIKYKSHILGHPHVVLTDMKNI